MRLKFTFVYLSCFVCLANFCTATTAVTGHIARLDTTTPGVTAYVRFWLRGTRGNQPRITGTGAIAPQFSGSTFYVDLPADASGNVSGTIYSTRDATGTGAGDIEAGGSYTAVYYGMQIVNGGIPGPEIPVHARRGGTLDIANVSPVSALPVVTAPTGDTTYLRIDGGNVPFLGNFTPSGNGTLALGASATRWKFFGTTLDLSGVATLSGGGTLTGTFTGGTFSGPTLTTATITAPTVTSPSTTGTDSGTETLVNKTLTAPVITNPSTTGTDSGTETLTNKTLTSPAVTGTIPGTLPATNLTLAGTLTNYNSIATVGNGIASEVALVDLTAQSAAVGTTTIYSVPSSGAGQYRVIWNSKVTTAAGTSSTLGPLTITYTDPDGTVVTTTMAGVGVNPGTGVGESLTTNTTSSVLFGFPILLNCKASTVIQYSFGYASNAANAMTYNLHIRLEAM